MQIVEVSVNDLKNAEYNPRALSEEEYKAIKDSIERFGFVQPLVVNNAPGRENVVIGGNQRFQIARDLGMATVPVLYVKIEDAEKEKELNLRLNKNTGHWDYDALANFHEGMLLDVGFTPTELDDIFELENTEQDPNESPLPPAVPTSRIGHIYALGDHRVMCGDSANPMHVAQLMNSQKASMLFTDPPYNVNYEGHGERTSEGIKNDNLSVEDFTKFIRRAFATMDDALADGAPYYICSGWTSYPVFHQELISRGFHRAGVIIWVKDTVSFGWNDFRHKHEWILVGKKDREGKTKAVSILYGWKKGSHYFRDTRNEYDVWEVPKKHAANYLHPTEKPVWLIEKAIANSSKRYDVVLDLFGGSGSTLIACERLTRKGYLMEFDPKYVDVIVRRWEKYTGQQATLIAGEGAAPAPAEAAPTTQG